MASSCASVPAQHVPNVHVATAVRLAFVTSAPLAAQDAPVALLPEPRLIARAVELVTGFTGDDLSGPKRFVPLWAGRSVVALHRRRAVCAVRRSPWAAS